MINCWIAYPAFVPVDLEHKCSTRWGTKVWLMMHVWIEQV